MATEPLVVRDPTLAVPPLVERPPLAPARITRVLHVAEAFGGSLMEVVKLVAEGAAQAGQPHAIAFGRRPETPEDVRAAVDAGVELFDLDWGRRTVPGEIAAARRLREIARTWQPDVVHLHSSFAGVVGGAALSRICPTISTPHALASQLATRSRPKRTAYRIAERLTLRSATVVGAVSNSEAQAARRLGAQRVVVVPNGIPELDPERAAVARRPRTGRPSAVGLGRLVSQRRPDAVGRILAAVSEIADVRWIGGGGERRLGSRDAMRGLRAAGIEVTGWLPRAEVLRRLEETTAYVHWSAIDGMALSILEAAAAGAVVVASDIPANRELLDPRQLCGSEDEAVVLLRRVITDTGFADELRHAQAGLLERHSAQAMVLSWLSVYAAVARLAPAS